RRKFQTPVRLRASTGGLLPHGQGRPQLRLVKCPGRVHIGGIIESLLSPGGQGPGAHHEPKCNCNRIWESSRPARRVLPGHCSACFPPARKRSECAEAQIRREVPSAEQRTGLETIRLPPRRWHALVCGSRARETSTHRIRKQVFPARAAQLLRMRTRVAQPATESSDSSILQREKK